MSSSQAAQPAPTSGTERRRYARQAVIGPVLIPVDIGPDETFGLMVNLSEQGAALQTLAPLAPGTQKLLSWKFASGEDPLQIHAEIIWSRDKLSGVRFIDLGESARARLHTWLQNLANGPVEEVAAPAESALELAPESDTSAGDFEFDMLVRRARSLTRADGAAIAIADGEDFICRASRGCAPDVGMTVHIDSGLSGACVRTGKVVCCADTESDPRVDAAVCRELNLRAVVVMPVKRAERVVGLLECLWSRPQAYTDADLAELQVLANDIVRVLDRAAGPARDRAIASAMPSAPSSQLPVPTPAPPPAKLPPVPERPAEKVAAGQPVKPQAAVPKPAPAPPPKPEAPAAPRQATVVAPAQRPKPQEAAAKPAPMPAAPAAADSAPLKILPIPEAPLEPLPPFVRSRRSLIAPAVLIAAVIVVAAVVYLVSSRWREPALPPPPPIQMVPQTSVPLEPASASAPAHAQSAAAKASANTGKSEREDTAPLDDTTVRSSPLALRSPAPLDTNSGGSDADVSPPSLSGGTGDQQQLVRIVTPTAAVPTFAPALSSVVPPQLVQRVQPRYPVEAAAQRLYGTVVLNVTVGIKGRITKIEVLKGDPRLVAAARSAVSQWVYKPAQLDGQPVPAVVSINVVFHEPSGR